MHVEAGAAGSWRAIRFASCVPRVLLQSAEPSIYGSVPACEEPHFDLYRHVTIAGVESLRAEPADLQARDQKVFNTSARRSHGDDPCRRLRRMLKSPTEVVIFRPSFEAYSGMFIRSCLQRMRPQTQQVTQYIRGSMCYRSCLPQLRRTSTDAARLPRLPPCTVGLHLRSLAIDSAGCNRLGDNRSGLVPKLCVRSRFHRVDDSTLNRRQQCSQEPFPLSIEGCPTQGARFSTSDSPLLYAEHTRPRGWFDLGEEATHSGYVGHSASQNNSYHRQALTVAAWFTLARCKRAIVAPVFSKFSDSAADAAGVPVFGCCSILKSRLGVGLPTTTLAPYYRVGSLIA
jgi:hypothetical protein